jgi:hypothetical protein
MRLVARFAISVDVRFFVGAGYFLTLIAQTNYVRTTFLGVDVVGVNCS